MTQIDPETVFVAGASGGTGREILRLVGPRVRTVRALTRSAEKRSDLLAEGADDVVVDDLLRPTILTDALDDVDVVLSAVGSDVADTFREGAFVDGAGTLALLHSAVEAGVDAFVMVSALGVGPEPVSPLATGFELAVGPVQHAKARAESAIREAPIRHTIVRPGVLTNGPRTDAVAVGEPGSGLWGTVSRADVARVVVAAPTTASAADRTFEVVSQPRFPDRSLSVGWRLPGDDP
jgi:uncharacterized protein YbjT (DUF2867 family)